MSAEILISNFSVAFVVSLIWGAFGFAVAKAKKEEDFKPEKFLKTLAVGLMLGLISTLTGVDVVMLENMSLTAVLVIFIDKFAGMLMES